MDHHYSKCDKHEEIYWHTITWGDKCPLCKMESPPNLPEANAYSLLADVRAVYDELLEDAIYLYQYYPNNFRKTAEEYFKKEIEMQKRLSEHFS